MNLWQTKKGGKKEGGLPLHPNQKKEGAERQGKGKLVFLEVPGGWEGRGSALPRQTGGERSYRASEGKGEAIEIQNEKGMGGGKKNLFRTGDRELPFRCIKKKTQKGKKKGKRDVTNSKKSPGSNIIVKKKCLMKKGGRKIRAPEKTKIQPLPKKKGER